MTDQSLSVTPQGATLAAEAATKGDLAKLSPEQRTALYGEICRSMGLNPLSRPFEYITLNGKLTLYATRTAADQLRKINGVSITSVEESVSDGILTVKVKASDKTGRTDMEIGAVSLVGNRGEKLTGEALANAHMKALTKAKRRVTLSISGLGWLDETEVSAVPSAHAVIVHPETGELESNAPLSRDVAPGRAEPPKVDRASTNRRLHAIAGEHDISHDQLHQWAVSRNYESLSNVDGGVLRDLCDALEKGGRVVQQFKDKFPDRPDYDEPQDNAEQVDLINDPEFNAAIDRDLAAAKARA